MGLLTQLQAPKLQALAAFISEQPNPLGILDGGLTCQGDNRREHCIDSWSSTSISRGLLRLQVITVQTL